MEERWVSSELFLDCSGCCDDVVVVHGGADVGREELPECFDVLCGFLSVSCVVWVVAELLDDVGDDFFDSGHFDV